VSGSDPGSPDPVRQARAYQDMLVGLVGADDPAAVQAATPAVLRRLVAEAGADLRTRPAPGEWSVLQCIGHLVDGEVVSSGRVRWILAQDEPELVGYDQDLWVDRLHGPADDPAALLALFEPLRRANLDLWARTPPERRARMGVHRERGRESYELVFTLTAGHDRFHVAQAHRALAAVRAAR
jgi:hypothetical protein